MEKVRFTIAFTILLATLPVIMFSELTRKDKATTEQKENREVRVSAIISDEAVLNHSSFMQAVYN